MPSILPRALRATCLAAVLAAAAPAFATERPLTLAEAQRLAVDRSRQLEAIGSGVEAARQRAHAARRLPDPVLSLSLENVPVEDINGTPGLHTFIGDTVPGIDRFSLADEAMTMRRIGLMQELTAPVKRRLRAERFEHEARRGETEREAARAMIRRDAALAWLDTWYSERMAAAIAEQRVEGLREAQAAEAEYRAGRGSQADVLAARTSLAMLDDRAAEMARKVKAARAMLARWTGEPGERALAAPPAFSDVALAHHGLEQQIAAHPELEVYARERDVKAAEARLAAVAKEPDWTVELAYSRRARQWGDMVSIGVRVPLPWDAANRQDREAAAALAEARRAEAEREEALRRHVAEVEAMLHEWDINRGRVARYEREILPLAAARVEAALGAFRGGKATLAELLGARRAALEARLQALQVEAETARLWAQLTFLSGEDAR